MKTIVYRSPYLLNTETPVLRRLRHNPWRLALPRRWPASPKLTRGVAGWGLILAIGVWASGTNGLKPPASQTTPASANVAATASLAAPVAVTTLAGGPNGNLLPPGTLAPYRTFKNTYMAGQCTWYVASRRQVPNNWGNARTWYPRAAAAGYSVGATPAVGAIAWTSAGYYGHVAVVEAVSGSQVMVAEMNYYGPYKINQRWTSASSFRYIY